MAKRPNNITVPENPTAVTPDYVRRAVARYDAKVTKKVVVLNPDNDSDIMKAIKKDKNMPFSKLCKHLLREHYQL